MAKAKVKSEKVDHVKFNHDTLGFISVQGNAAGSDDYDIEVSISDGEDRLNLYLNANWQSKNPVELLKMYQEGISKALEFVAKASKMGPRENVWGANSINKQTEDKIRAKKSSAKPKPL
jgi:hypothetical protein